MRTVKTQWPLFCQSRSIDLTEQQMHAMRNVLISHREAFPEEASPFSWVWDEISLKRKQAQGRARKVVDEETEQE